MSKKLTQEEFEEKFNSLYKDRFRVIGQYQNAITPIDVQCCNCNQIVSRKPNHLDSGSLKCPRCEFKHSTRGILVGVNDIWSTDPDVAKILSNKEDGYNYRINTSKKLSFTCPNCGKTKFCFPSNIKTRGFSCDTCSDGVSYPNKLIRNILKLLNIQYTPEYSVIIEDNRYFYDVMFIYQNQKYIVEMDGGYGHGHKNTVQRNIDEQMLIDNIKNNYAYANNIEIIRIDCNYEKMFDRYEYIKTEIKSSLLCKILPITDEIFNEANLLSLDSNIIIFSKLWNSGIRSYHELMKHLDIKSKSTIRRYAKCCTEIGLIPESYDEFLNQTEEKQQYLKTPQRTQPIRCVETGDVFLSMIEARRKMGINHLERFFSGQTSYCGTLDDGTKLTWERITKDEYFNLIK